MGRSDRIFLIENETISIPDFDSLELDLAKVFSG
jgi:hypothetical protein